MAWWIQPMEIASDAGVGSGRWRMTAKSDEGGGGPYGDTSHDHASAEEAEACDACDEFCSRIAGFPSRRDEAKQWEAHERAEYERLKEKFKPPPPPPILTLQEQFEQLQAKYPKATIEEIRTGHLATLPDLPLPEGYTRSACTAYFIVPRGYPFAKPERFYTDDLRRVNGFEPNHTRLLTDSERKYHGFTTQPELRLWFWMVQSWDPRRDTLKTYVSVILNRLNKVNAGDHRYDGD